MKRTVSYFLVGFICVVLSDTSHADVLPLGHKNVSHKIVFEPSDALENHRIVAAPIAGFHGEQIVKPGEAFRFSSKYGTKFYAIPKSVDLPKFDREVYAEWPATRPPISQTNSVIISSPVASALSIVKLTAVDDSGPLVELVKHEEFDRFGFLITPERKVVTRAAYFGIPIIVGIGLCVILLVRRKNKGSRIEQVGE